LDRRTPGDDRGLIELWAAESARPTVRRVRRFSIWPPCSPTYQRLPARHALCDLSPPPMDLAEVISHLKSDGWSEAGRVGRCRLFRHHQRPGVVTIAGGRDLEVHASRAHANATQGPTRAAYAVLIERGASSCGVSVPDLPGCVAVGRDAEEAMSLIRDAVDAHIASLRGAGLPIPCPRTLAAMIDVGDGV